MIRVSDDFYDSGRVGYLAVKDGSFWLLLEGLPPIFIQRGSAILGMLYPEASVRFNAGVPVPEPMGPEPTNP